MIKALLFSILFLGCIVELADDIYTGGEQRK